MSKIDISLDLDYLPALPKDKSIGIGCAGAGFIMDDCQLVAYKEHDLNVVAIASRTGKRACEVAARHQIKTSYDTYEELLADKRIQILDVAVPPDIQLGLIQMAVRHDHIKGILAQKPLGVDYKEAVQIVKLCQDAGITLAVNQNMRYDHSVAACKCVIDRGYLGTPVLGTIDMRAIPHWMPWQERQGWCTLRIMSIHHLDTFRYWFGDPVRIFASIRPDPRTQFKHEDGICLYILEYEDGLRASSWDDVWAGPAREGAAEDIGINYRVEGTEGMVRGTIGWPKYPARTPSTMDFTSVHQPGYWLQPRWDKVWFPDAFIGPMAQLMIAMENGAEPTIGGKDNLKTMALVDAAYLSAKEHRAVELAEIHTES